MFRRCIIVDSTRRGKSMPDALSKTIGIWIVVLNRLLFGQRPDSHELMTPSEVVSDSEHSQIEERLDRFVEEVRRLDLNLDELREKVKKPMRPYWVTPATSLDSLSRPSDDYIAVAAPTSATTSPTATKMAWHDMFPRRSSSMWKPDPAICEGESFGLGFASARRASWRWGRESEEEWWDWAVEEEC